MRAVIMSNFLVFTNFASFTPSADFMSPYMSMLNI